MRSSAPWRQRSARSVSPRRWARSAPRSAATQHRTAEAVKCWGSPRISQMPWSASPLWASASSTSPASPSQTAWTIWAAPRLSWVSTPSRSMPHTSFWCWFQAPLPTRTGRAPSYPDRWSRVLSVRSRSPPMPYMIWSSNGWSSLPWLTALQHEGEVLERLPVEAQTIERSQHESGVPDPGVAVVPVAGAARRLGEGGRRGGHDRPGRGVAQALEGQGAALDVRAPRVVGERPGGQPVTPVGHRGVDIPVGLVLVGRGDPLPTTGR